MTGSSSSLAVASCASVLNTEMLAEQPACFRHHVENVSVGRR